MALLVTGSGNARTVDPTVLLVLLAATVGLFGHTVDAVVAVTVAAAVAVLVAVVLTTGAVGREDEATPPTAVKALMEYFAALLLGLVTLLAVL